MSERLQKFLARAGVASRRHAELLITAGRVSVNNQPVTELGSKVEPTDLITVDGKLVTAPETTSWYLLHKPAGVVTTLADPEGRPTVAGLLEGVEQRVFPVGRLDWDAEGALLLTNDGATAHRLLHPSFEVPRTYLAKVKGSPTDETLARLLEGVRLEDGPARALRAQRFEAAERNTWVLLQVGEGRPHLVKRLCAAVGHPVVRLFRPAQAGISVAGLQPGALRPLTVQEIQRVEAVAAGTSVAEPVPFLPPRRHGRAGDGEEPEGGEAGAETQGSPEATVRGERSRPARGDRREPRGRGARGGGRAGPGAEAGWAGHERGGASPSRGSPGSWGGRGRGAHATGGGRRLGTGAGDRRPDGGRARGAGRRGFERAGGPDARVGPGGRGRWTGGDRERGRGRFAEPSGPEPRGGRGTGGPWGRGVSGRSGAGRGTEARGAGGRWTAHGQGRGGGGSSRAPAGRADRVGRTGFRGGRGDRPSGAGAPHPGSRNAGAAPGRGQRSAGDGRTPGRRSSNAFRGGQKSAGPWQSDTAAPDRFPRHGAAPGPGRGPGRGGQRGFGERPRAPRPAGGRGGAFGSPRGDFHGPGRGGGPRGHGGGRGRFGTLPRGSGGRRPGAGRPRGGGGRGSRR